MILKISSFLIFSALLMAQSPWPQPSGSLSARISWTIIPAYDRLYVKTGKDFSTERRVQDMTIQTRFEYGIGEKDATSLIFILPLKFVQAGDVVDPDLPVQSAESSLKASGNIRLGWKQKWHDDSWLFSSRILVEFPSAKYQAESGLRSGYEAWAGILSLSGGKGFGQGYFYAHGGWGWRSHQYSSFILSGIEGGYQLANFIWAGLVVEWLNSMQNGTRIDPPNNLLTGLYVNDQQYTAWGVKFFGDLIRKKLGYSVALFGAFSGNFVPKSPSINLSLSYQFNL